MTQRHESKAQSSDTVSSRNKPSFGIESLEPRVLLSATLADGMVACLGNAPTSDLDNRNLGATNATDDLFAEV